MSLTESIGRHFSTSMGRKLSEVAHRANIFLNHLRAVSQGDTSANDFADRFGKNVEALRKQ